MSSASSSSASAPSQKLFYRPGVIEEQEEASLTVNEEPVTFKIGGGESPLLCRNGQHYLMTPSRIPKVPSLTRVSTCNSSLSHYPAYKPDGYGRRVTVADMSSASSSSASAPSQKLFYRPGVIEEQEEASLTVNEEPVTFKIGGGESPLLCRNGQHYLMTPSRIPKVPSLTRVSTCNSSLSHYPAYKPEGYGRKSFRPTGRKAKKRAIFKNGDCNILQSRISKRRLRFLQDMFTTLVDTQWRWTLIVFAIAFLGSWLGFALIWWLITFTHGDLEPDHLPDRQEDSEWTPCVVNIHGFTSCFLFSIETQHTIGYGGRATTEECPEAIFIMCAQSIIGMMIQAFMVGIVFAKMTRPKHRTQTLLFSRNAVICQRDGTLCLMFRVGDMRKSHIIGASIRAQLIRPRKTKEGELLPNYQTELSVTADGCDGNLFFIWPMTVIHRIDEQSPFYHLTAGDMLQDKFEIVVILEGTIESTGQSTQARSSYLAGEILWGHRFEAVVAYNKDRQGYEVNYSKFDGTLAVDTPLCSGAELAEFYRLQESGGEAALFRMSSDEYSPVMYRNTSPIRLQTPPARSKHAPRLTSGSSQGYVSLEENNGDSNHNSFV